MYNKIIEILQQLNIDIAINQYEGDSDEYILIGIYKDEDSDFFDNINLSETYYINVTYWFKSKTNIEKYKKIKSLLKKHGFIYDGGKELDDDYYMGRSLDFIYTEYEIEGEE